MKRRRFILACASLASGQGRALASEPSTRANIVYPVSQGNANLCWLAAAAMLMSYIQQSPVTMGRAAAILGGEFSKIYSARLWSDASLDIRQVGDLARAIGVTAGGFACYEAQWWLERAVKGPIAIIGVNAKSSMAHAIVVTTIWGDPQRPHEVMLRFIDPADGLERESTLDEKMVFYEKFPSISKVSGPQVLHFDVPRTDGF